MNKIKELIRHYVFSEELSSDAKMINMICLVGMTAAFLAVVSRIIMRSNLPLILVMLGVLCSIGFLMFLSNRFKLYTIGIWVTLLTICDVLFPLAFFTLGGAEGGMAAYFAVSMVLIFLLLRGKSCAIMLITHIVWVVSCYYIGYRFPGLIIPLGTSQIYIGNVQAFLISGFFIGTVIKFQNKIYFNEKKKAAEAVRSLAVAQQSAATMFDSNPHINILFDEHFNLLDCNPAAMAFMGFTKKEEMLSGFMPLLSQSIPKTSESSIALTDWFKITMREGSIQFETEINLRGNVRIMNVEMKRIPYENSFAIVCYLVDITALQKARNDLMHRDRLLSAVNEVAAVLLSESGEVSIYDKVAEALRILSIGVDVDRAFLWLNNRKEDGVLYSKQIAVWQRSGKSPELIELPFDKVLHGLGGERPEDGISIINVKVKDLPPGAIDHNATLGMKALLVTPIMRSRQFTGFITFEDYTRERRFSKEDEDIISYGAKLIGSAFRRADMVENLIQARKEAETANASKSIFLSNMSHEMRTPMNAIIGMTAIAKSSFDVERKDYCLLKIEDASTHLLGVINDILDMSKIEANKFELSFDEFNFEKMLQKTVNVINFRVDEKQQNFTVHIDRDIPHTVIGDDQRLAQVIANLLSNAVKFTPEYGSVRLAAYLEKEEDKICTLKIEVSDTGIGISEEQQSRLFTSFEQAESRTSRKFGGTGLGLAISKRIVELMGGRIWIESELGKGSTFIFTALLERGFDADRDALSPGINLNNARVLAVDDAPDIREYFLEIAQRININCDAAPGGEEALRLIEQNGSYDIYFIDWKMPGMNGIELARRIKERDGPGESVIIMISSVEWAVIEQEAKNAGVDKFLSKPLFPSAIADCINECLGQGSLAAAKNARSGETDDFTGYRVLLAEDVEINREIVTALLEPTGLVIDCAENGLEAVSMFRNAPGKYDMIFMDVQMPEIDGYEATRLIRDLPVPEAPRVPIVAMTANVFREDIEKCLDAGMNDHVGKPLDFGEVLTKLRTYLPASKFSTGGVDLSQ
jgi:PAS domain S-box-containing protein